MTVPTTLVWAGYGGGPGFINSGSASFTTNFTFNSANVTNLNAWFHTGGEMTVINSNFRHAGNATLGATAILGLDGGTIASIEGPVTAPANALRFRGSDTSVLTRNLFTPSLWQSAGTVRQLTNVTVARYNQSGGTWLMTTPSSIANYALTNGELRGQALTATNVWWLAGTINRDGDGSAPVLTVPAGGLLALTTTADHNLSTYDGSKPGHVRVAGTFTWANDSRILGSYGSRLELLATSTISGQATFVWAGYGNGPVFNNRGSVSYSTNFTFNYATVTNGGAWNLQGGTQTYLNSTLGQGAGTYSLSGGQVAGSATTTTFTGGTLSGTGAFGLPFVNTGATVAPGASPGVLQFPSFNQTAGTLFVEVGRGIPGTNSDLVRVTGAATVGGKIKVKLLPGVGTNDQYTVVTTTARTGTFNPIEQPANGVVEAIYSTTNVVLNLKELFEGSAPTVIGQPLDLTLNNGGSGAFAAFVSGTDPITFRWQKNGTNIDGASTTNLNIGPVSALDAAGYRLIAENDFGASTSRVARLNVRQPLQTNPGDVIPIARWHLDEPADSTVVLDSAPNRYDGTNSPAGTLSVAAGRAGRALQLNRTNGGLVNMGPVLSLATNDFTVVAWVKSSPGANGFASYLSKHTLTFNNGYALNLNASGGNGLARKASWYATTPAGSGTEPRSVTNVDDGNWHQIVATHRADGSANAIYVDGSPVEHSTPGSVLVPNAAFFLLGGVTSAGNPTSTFAGSLDEIGIFDRILSDAQVDYLFNNPAADGIPDIAAPAIVTALTNQFIAPGSNASLALGVTGTAPLTFQWTRDGIVLPGAGLATLSLTNVQCDTDTGSYAVRISNAYGAVTSAPVLVGLNLPLFEPEGFRAWYACSGRNPTNTDPDWDYFRVSTSKDTYYTNGAWFIDTDGAAELLYWRKTGVAARFPANGVIEFRMKMGPGTSSSTARGWVTVSFNRGDGRLGVLNFNATQLWFNAADLTPGTKVTTPGTDDFHTYRLEFAGTPGADNAVRLFKDGVQVATGTMFADASRTQPGLAFGEGSVLATGTSQWRFFRHTSTAGPALVINDQPDAQAQPFAGAATFSVAASGQGTIRYQWRKDAVEIPGATNATFTLPYLVLGSAGTYSVVVSDDYDSLPSANAVLTVVRPLAATVTWTNTAGGTWNVPTNWSPNLVPDATDTALIPLEGTYTVTNTANANVLHLTLSAEANESGATLTGGNLLFAGSVTVENVGTLRNITLGGGASGTVDVRSGGRLVYTTPRVLGAITTNRGVIELTESVTLNQPLNNEPDGRITLDGIGRFTGSSPLINRGLLRSTTTQGDVIAINTPFTTTGTLEIPSGNTVIARVGASNVIGGSVQIGTNSTLTLGPGDHRFAAAGPAVASGRIDIDSLIGLYAPPSTVGYLGLTRVYLGMGTNWWTTLNIRRSVSSIAGVDTLVHLAPNTVLGGTNLHAGGTLFIPVDSTARFERHVWSGGILDGTNGTLHVTPNSVWSAGRLNAGLTARVAPGINWRHATGVREIAGTVENLGDVQMESGLTSLIDTARWNNRAGSILNLAGAWLGSSALNTALLNEGLVSGSGNLETTVTNNGILRPGNPIGTFLVRSLNQGPLGRIELDLAAGNPGLQYDQVTVTGAAQLDGVLALRLTDGYTPTLADVFAIIPHGSRTGVFASIENPSLATLVPNYAPTRVQLNVSEVFTPAPLITRQPFSQTVPAGAQVVLSLGIRGTEPISYQWTSNNIALTGATSSVLVLESVQPGTTTYRVTASNTFGQVTSDPATVTVNPGVIPTPGIASPGIVGPLNSITFLNSLFGFVTGDNGAFRYTTNGGTSWLTSIPGVTNKITGAAFYGGAYWISGSGGLLCVSYDGGRSWIPFDTGTTETFTGINGLLSTNIATIRHDYTNLACVPIPFRAVASDPDDSVFAVELYINGFPIDNDPANPVEHIWDNCTPGRYWLAALAVDTRGAVAYSENIGIVVVPPLHILVPAIRTDGLFRLCYAGDTDKAYGVEISTDLENWSYLGPFFPTNSILQYLDASVTNNPHRLYRAIEIPKGE